MSLQASGRWINSQLRESVDEAEWEQLSDGQAAECLASHGLDMYDEADSDTSTQLFDDASRFETAAAKVKARRMKGRQVRKARERTKPSYVFLQKKATVDVFSRQLPSMFTYESSTRGAPDGQTHIGHRMGGTRLASIEMEATDRRDALEAGETTFSGFGDLREVRFGGVRFSSYGELIFRTGLKGTFFDPAGQFMPAMKLPEIEHMVNWIYANTELFAKKTQNAHQPRPRNLRVSDVFKPKVMRAYGITTSELETFSVIYMYSIPDACRYISERSNFRCKRKAIFRPISSILPKELIVCFLRYLFKQAPNKPDKPPPPYRVVNDGHITRWRDTQGREITITGRNLFSVPAYEIVVALVYCYDVIEISLIINHLVVQLGVRVYVDGNGTFDLQTIGHAGRIEYNPVYADPASLGLNLDDRLTNVGVMTRLGAVMRRLRPVRIKGIPVATAYVFSQGWICLNTHVAIEVQGGVNIGDEHFPVVWNTNLAVHDLSLLPSADRQYEKLSTRPVEKGELVFFVFCTDGGLQYVGPVPVTTLGKTSFTAGGHDALGPGASGALVVAMSDLTPLGLYSGRRDNGHSSCVSFDGVDALQHLSVPYGVAAKPAFTDPVARSTFSQVIRGYVQDRDSTELVLAGKQWLYSFERQDFSICPREVPSTLCKSHFTGSETFAFVKRDCLDIDVSDPVTLREQEGDLLYLACDPANYATPGVLVVDYATGEAVGIVVDIKNTFALGVVVCVRQLTTSVGCEVHPFTKHLPAYRVPESELRVIVPGDQLDDDDQWFEKTGFPSMFYLESRNLPSDKAQFPEVSSTVYSVAKLRLLAYASEVFPFSGPNTFRIFCSYMRIFFQSKPFFASSLLFDLGFNIRCKVHHIQLGITIPREPG